MHFKKRTAKSKSLKRLARDIRNQSTLERLLEDMPREEALDWVEALRPFLSFVPEDSL